MLRFMIIIIEYLETTLFQSRYAKIDSNYHRLSYPMIIITHRSTIHSRLWGSHETDNGLELDVLGPYSRTSYDTS